MSICEAARPQPIVITLEVGDERLRLGDRHQARRPGPFGGDHAHERMRGFARNVRHLRRQRAARRKIGHQARKQPVVIGQELQRGVGEDEIRLILGRPIRNVLLDEFRLRRAHAGMGKHGVGGVEADDSRVRKTAQQQFRAVAGPTAQIVDEACHLERNPRQEIARRAHPLGLEFRVEGRVPIGHQHEFRSASRRRSVLAQYQG